MTFDEIQARVSAAFAEAVVEVKDEPHQQWLRVDPSQLTAVGTFLRDTEGLAFDDLSNLTATDYLAKGDDAPGRIELVYHLWSLVHHHLLVLKAEVDRDKAQLPSLAEVWPAADWHEREMFDLVGVKFTGHPDLRRLLLPEDWPGHPLRKDWVEPESYHGMPTTRHSSNTLFADYQKELAGSEPLRALVIYEDGAGAKTVADTLAQRLTVADFIVDVTVVEKAQPAQLSSYELVIFGGYSSGMLFSGQSAKLGSFIELLPDLDGQDCGLYMVYAGQPKAALTDLDSKLARKRAKILARGAVIKSKPTQDPNGLAAALIDAVRVGDIKRQAKIVEPPPAAPEPSTPPAPAEPVNPS